MLLGKKKKHVFIDLDPRMKLLLVVLFTTITYMSTSTLMLVWYYILIIGLYLACGLWKGALKTALLFTVFLVTGAVVEYIHNEETRAALALIVFFLQRTAIFFVMANWVSARLRISDFIQALQKIHIPKGAIITLAVVFRYMPTVKEELYYIKNTMELRNIGLKAKNIFLHPIKTIEYVVVPLLIRSLTIADELSASAMTRGLDLETKRSSYRDVRLNFTDIIVTFLIVVAAFGGVILNKFLLSGGSQ